MTGEKAGALLPAALENRRRDVEGALLAVLPREGAEPAALVAAMRYSVLAGGKRLRPLLFLAGAESCGAERLPEDALEAAVALELLHTYSLIHDDLPCMDDDDMRRGRPTNHKVYGEAIATLAGDALLTDAFKVLARSAHNSAPPALVLETIAELAGAAGSAGMVAGQVIDLLGEGKSKTVEELEELHGKKTGALFLASVRGGARLGGASAAQIESLDAYARALGLAFQVVDDLLDVQGTPEQMGKRTQKDVERGKATYPAILGIERSLDLARELETRAHRAIAGFGNSADALRHIATFVVERKL